MLCLLKNYHVDVQNINRNKTNIMVKYIILNVDMISDEFSSYVGDMDSSSNLVIVSQINLND